MDLQRWLAAALDSNVDWSRSFGQYARHPSLEVTDDRFAGVFAQLTERLKDNYPFFHPRYAGQMLKPPHPAAVVGYLTTMLINPNNHALDGGPATATMEREVVQQLAEMFGYETHLGHLTTSGTIANLEALFVARSLHPSLGVAYSAEAHYTHSRMCTVLGIEGHSVPVDPAGRMDLDALEDLLRTGRVGTVVLTAGTTGLGAIDPIDEALGLREKYGVRIHVDAAYGGFFTLLAGELGIPAGPWQAVAAADSIVIDPHKHGLQPYGCGAILFRDPEVGKFYLHDSPYTYFTSDELHLGEISLECSRAGAAAAALWLTFQLIPPTRDGLGEALAAGRRAAIRWAELIDKSEVLELYQNPTLDIVGYFPAARSLSAVDAVSARILDAGMTADDPVFLSTFRVSAEAFLARHPDLDADVKGGRILRSVLMKPESEDYVDQLHARLEALT
ncbi:glutamate/tyrosine decarboxylase-like PLP-dependent enzyme [Kibdelosporangium banguiense]|uniref:Glutamate/tyrosine decarboxylase-like PLP-dependent enzyme n=1 Tax=Kibdelosporangium banguiense TaxID=1365924 RepID=A0ABS4TTF8_9PSEU|nr:aminotransferase class I/II-fold pyridoxal phosphate-dependent enzyme [Kibdelosporangium banguiense]MBP2327672.1 glutamate/tyrosine decarboxylase-like PLP-dependent enzyme [Kibdelosporangium banguiense]